jgi:hypothetical protein
MRGRVCNLLLLLVLAIAVTLGLPCRLSPRDITGKYAVTIVVELAQNVTKIQLEMIIFSIKLTNKQSP